ncbi:MAG TPA: SWIM zinc finger family protein [Pirellulaceae bacterium]|nr:SWIM zinc finger family protein [Pirellulaceae bacterium]
MSWYERGYGYSDYAPYVPVAKRRANAARYAKKLAAKEGRELAPVKITSRAMAATFGGKAWCDNLEAYSDYANRLPRGRTYARNGSVIDLQIKSGIIEAIVSGSRIYTVEITIETLASKVWSRLKTECSESITSLIDLLCGRFDAGVMQKLVHPKTGLFPSPKEIEFACSCPDSATLCKHVAAVLYGVGNRLDVAPEVLFTLRNVDHLELVSQAVAEGNLDRTLEGDTNTELVGSDLSEMFGIDLGDSSPAPKKAARAKKAAAASTKALVAKHAKSATKSRKKQPVSPAKSRPARKQTPQAKQEKALVTTAAKRRKAR